MKKNIFATRWGIIVVGAIIGILAPLLQKFGNPGNMGVCVACFTRDITGAIGLHRASVVQFMRPEIIGFVLGSFAAALIFKEFKPRGGSAPFVRFILGAFAMIGALVFLGCPWRALLRLGGGDLNAIAGIAGLIAGIYVGTLFFKNGYSLGRSNNTPAFSGILMPVIMAGLLVLALVFPAISGEAKNGVLFYSVKGPGAMHPALWISIGAGLIIGFIAQRSRFCTMGAYRDLLLFKQFHLFSGLLAFLIFALIANLMLGQFKLGFTGQSAAHTLTIWNFAGMFLAGLAFCLAGGCPGRQLFLSGEGDNDAGIFVVGMVTGAAFAHNFGLAASPKGLGPHTIAGVVIGLTVCVLIGLFMKTKK